MIFFTTLSTHNNNFDDEEIGVDDAVLDESLSDNILDTDDEEDKESNDENNTDTDDEEKDDEDLLAELEEDADEVVLDSYDDKDDI